MKKSILLGIIGLSLITVVGQALLVGALKPVQYTWKAVVLDSSQNMVPGVYNDSDEFANVMVFIREYSGRAYVKTYTPVFWLEVLSPMQIDLRGIAVNSWGSNLDFNHCGFPEGGTFPSCWEFFLNGSHPKDGYQRASFMHDGERFITREEADFTKMQFGETRVMNFNLVIQGQEIMGSCDQCNPTNYHQVDGDAQGWTKPGIGSPYDIYLTRIDENTWKVVVSTDFDNPDRQDQWSELFSWGADKIWESYCECVQEKVGKRTVLTKYTRQSSWVRTHIGYEILFIRTPK